MAKQAPARSRGPQNVERGNPDEEREARVAEMVTRLKRDGAVRPSAANDAKSPRPSRGK